MIFTFKLNIYIAGSSILGIIIGKLCYKIKLYPILLFEIYKGSKINFYYTILLFDLAICL